MQKFETKNFTPGKNTKRFIIVHHSGTKHGTTQGIHNAIMGARQISYHYLIDENGDVRKYNNDESILWHAGVSSWQGLSNLNNHSIGVCVLGIDTFTEKQKIATRHLINTIMRKENIPHTNILRHADIAPNRKTDIHMNFVTPMTWKQYQDSFILKPTMTEVQYKMKIQASMLDHSLQHQLADRIADEKKRKEVREALATLNRLYRELGYDRP